MGMVNQERKTGLKRRVDNEEAIAYSLIAIVSFIVFVALLYILLTPLFGGVIGVTNDQVDDGMLSHSTIATMDWSISLFHIIPIVSIIGIFIWGHIRAIERGGGD